MRNRTELRPAQLRIIDEIKASAGLQVILGMGGGKSVSALTAISDLLDDGVIGAAIVIAPMRVATTTWPDEIKKWDHLRHIDMAVLSGTPARRSKLLAEDHQIYVCSIDSVVWLIDELRKLPRDDRRWDMLVIDELSRLKSPRGARAKKIARFAERFGAIIGLTGTPRPNGWEDLYMPLRIVSAGQAWGGVGFDDWRSRHFVSQDPFGYNWEVRDSAVPALRQVVDDWSLSIPPSEASTVDFNCGADFDVVVPLSRDAMKDLATMEQHLFVELGVSGRDAITPDLVVALSKAVGAGKMAQILQGFLYQEGEAVKTYQNAKLDAVADLLEGIGHEPTILVYHYKEDLAALRSRFGNIPHLGNGVSARASVDLIRAWNAGEVPLMALHPASAGHGIELQFGGRRMIWYHMTWSAELFSQACKRIARPGQQLPVYVHRVLADHWLERLRVARVEEKIAEEHLFIEGVRR